MTADLIARLEAAESGSRELDDAVWWPIAKLGPYHREVDGRRERNIMAPFGQEDWRPIGPYDLPPALTTSLDAITALIGQKLPGYEWSVGWDMEVGKFYGATNGISTFWGSTAPLALCVALLKATAHG
jgi:hypothetical protein